MTRRILSIFPTLVIVSVIIFVALRVVPGDPVTILAQGQPLTQEQRLSLRAEYHLNESLPQQYVAWLRGAVHGDLGNSLKTGKSVTGLIRSSLEPTIILLAGAFVFSLVISVPLGIIAAYRAGRISIRGSSALRSYFSASHCLCQASWQS